MIQILNNGYCFDKKALLRAIRRVTAELHFRGAVTVKIAADDEVRRLNKQYRRQDRVTDVLSFALGEKLPDGLYAGDILICWSLAEKQARENNHSLQKEMLLLMIHGLLHLNGYDHEKDKGEMLALQQRLFAMHAGELA
ncbi:MAG: rRNA maturation RNase YbeY [Candidatus Aminicenantes bacterium]|nr:rRNA maturation RNase YbeY [Candidatus Aminicenantes bacterium]